VSGGAAPGNLAAASLTAVMAKAPSTGITLAGNGALAAAPSGRKPASGSRAVFAYGGLTSVIAANVTESRQVLAGVAQRVAAATHPARSASATAHPAPSARATAQAQATSAPRATSTTLSCNTSYGMLPLNVTAIVSFLLRHGYSHNAAAGIAGNIYQESKGDPESVGMGGGGLIGFTPLPGGYVTGNAAADLQTQLSAVLTYNQQWSAYLPELNSAATPADAAYVYVTDFERAGIPAAATREASATEVASACGI
jgi:hypothetical protein